MILDPKSNAIATITDAHAALADAANRNSTSLDLVTGRSVTHLINVSAIAAGTLTVKLQYSVDNSTWVDEPDTDAGNTVSVAITAAGLAQVHAPNPRGRYSRVNGAAVGGIATYSVITIQGHRKRA